MVKIKVIIFHVEENVEFIRTCFFFYCNKVVLWFTLGALRESAANANVFIFFLHPFFTSKISTKTFKTKTGLG